MFCEGNERKLLRALISSKSLCLCEAVIEEAKIVASKHGLLTQFDGFLEIALKESRGPVTHKSAMEKYAYAKKILRDKSDAPILAAFMASGADYLVSGDKDLLSLKGKNIITTRQALEILGHS